LFGFTVNEMDRDNFFRETCLEHDLTETDVGCARAFNLKQAQSRLLVLRFHGLLFAGAGVLHEVSLLASVSRETVKHGAQGGEFGRKNNP